MYQKLLLLVPVALAAQWRGSGLSITSGNAASPGQFPYQVAIYLDMTDFCGGSVISEQWILTAAHCIDGFKRFIVFLNAFNMHLPKETNRAVMATVEHRVHEGYDKSTYLNDIGLIRLPRVISKAGVVPVNLPARSAAQPAAGSPALLSGWGVAAQGYTVISPELNYVRLEIISQEECAKTYGYLVITSEKLCATGRGPCQGDTGGPLVMESGENFTQVAIASFLSSRGCESGAPAGFVRISNYLDWISKQSGIEINA